MRRFQSWSIASYRSDVEKSVRSTLGRFFEGDGTLNPGSPTIHHIEAFPYGGEVIDLDAPLFEADPIAAAIAHGALNSMAVVLGTFSTLSLSWEQVDRTSRVALLACATRHAEVVADLLRDLIGGLPVGATADLPDL